MSGLLLASFMLSAQTETQGTGAPERVLAGINLQQMKIPEVQKMYGPQEAMYAVPPDPYPPGTRLYKWGRLTVTLKVLTEPAPNGEVIRVVEVSGEPWKIGRRCGTAAAHSTATRNPMNIEAPPP